MEPMLPKVSEIIDKNHVHFGRVHRKRPCGPISNEK